MSDYDKAEKDFVSYPDIFADTVNALMYEGSLIVSEENLIPAPTESLYPDHTKDKLKNQFRDYAMYEMRNGKIHAKYGFENQSEPDPKMPLRKAGYDGESYRLQYEGKVTDVFPVFTIVLNWGKKRWNTPQSIREMIDLTEYAPQAERYLDKNSMYVFNMCRLSKKVRERFQSDMRIVADYLADSKSFEASTQKIKHPSALFRMLHELSGDERYQEVAKQIAGEQKEKEHKEKIGEGKRREEYTVCEILDKYWNGGLAQGRKEARKEAAEEIRALKKENKALNKTNAILQNLLIQNGIALPS